jgi:hypothetical protein
MGHFKSLFIDPWGTWIMAAVLAMIVWGYLFYESRDSVSLEVELKLQIAESDRIESVRLEDKEGLPVENNRIKIVLTGSRGVVQAVQKSDIRCAYSVERLVTRPHPFVLSRQNLVLPEDVHVRFVTGPEFRISYERLVEVQAALSGNRPDPRHLPAKDFAFDKYEIVPPVVRALVPDTRKMWVETNGIPLKAPDITGWVSGRSAPVIPDVDFPCRLLDKAEMHVIIRAKNVSKMFAKVPIHVQFNPELKILRFELSPTTTCDVTLEGRESVLAGVTHASIRAFAFVDRAPAQDGTTVSPAIEVIAAEGVRVLKIEPPNASMKLYLR